MADDPRSRKRPRWSWRPGTIAAALAVLAVLAALTFEFVVFEPRFVASQIAVGTAVLIPLLSGQRSGSGRWLRCGRRNAK